MAKLREMLCEADAWRIALAWQETLQVCVHLVSSSRSASIVGNYDWVTYKSNLLEGIDVRLNEQHVFKAACTSWFALSCCRGYSGRENPLFWKRVFGELRDPQRPPPSAVNIQARPGNPVSDAIEFFNDEGGQEFPRVQLVTQGVFSPHHREREFKLLRAFFHGVEQNTPAMIAINDKLQRLLDELKPYMEPSRSNRVIPVSLKNTTMISLPMRAKELHQLLMKLPTTASQCPSSDVAQFTSAFVLQEIAGLQEWTPCTTHMDERMKTLFQTHPVDVDSFYFSRTSLLNQRIENLKMVLSTEGAVQFRVRHGAMSVAGQEDSLLLEPLCSALPHTRSLKTLTIRGGSVSTIYDYKWAWIGYSLFHPDGPKSTWMKLNLLEHTISMDNIQILEAMLAGNNLLAIRSGQPPRNTAYHSARMRLGSIVRIKPHSDADVLYHAIVDAVVDVALASDDEVDSLPVWVGVIIPAHGLGWTLATNLSDVTTRKSSHGYLRALTLANEVPIEALFRLLTLLGSSLRFLDIGSLPALASDLMAQVLQLCPSLRSLRVSHDGSFWTADHQMQELPHLRELALRLPQRGELVKTRVERDRRKRARTSRGPGVFLTPSESNAKSSLGYLRALCLEADDFDSFNESECPIQEALERLSGLDYFHFNVKPNIEDVEPMSYAQARAFSLSCLSSSWTEDKVWRWIRGTPPSECYLALLSVCRHTTTCDSAMQSLDSDVIRLVVDFASSGSRTFWVEHKGKPDSGRRR